MGSASEAKIALKSLIAQNIDQAVKRFEEILDPASPAYNTFVLLKSRYNQYRTNIVLGMIGQDEINKQYAQISHAFIMTVDALEDSDLKAIVPPPTPPPPPVEEIPPRQPEEKKPRHKEESPKAEAKADKSFAATPVQASVPPKRDSAPPVATPVSTAGRKYLAIGAVVLTIAAVAIWAMSSGKEKPVTSSLADIPAGTTGLKQPDTVAKANAVQPQSSNTPQKTVETPVKQPAEPATETKKAAASAAAVLGAGEVSFDGKTYRVFRSGGRTWMAQNLDYPMPGSWCYGGSDENCLKYGRLYTLSAAKKACAAMGAGWHVPTANEWKNLTLAFGGAGEDAKDGGAAAFKALTAGGAKGFSAQLGGWRNDEGKFRHLGSSGYYWSSTENDLGLIQIYLFSNGEVSEVNNDPKLGFSCRCVK